MSLWIGAGNARAEVLTTPVAGPLMLEVDGEVQKVGFPAGDGRGLYFQADDVKEIFGISVLDYPDGTVILQGGDTKATLTDEVVRNQSGLRIYLAMTWTGRWDRTGLVFGPLFRV